MHELLLILGLLAGIAAVTALLQHLAPRVQQFRVRNVQMPSASPNDSADGAIFSRNPLEPYLSYRC